MRLPRNKDKIVGHGYCEECEKECEVKAEVVSWDYTQPNGSNGVHVDGTDFLSDCCDGHVYTNEELTLEFEADDIDVDYDYDGPDTYDEARGVA